VENVCQLRDLSGDHQTDGDPRQDAGQESLDVLIELIYKADKANGCIEPVEVLKLAAAAAEAVESLLSDMEQAGREAVQEAIFENIPGKGNA